MSFFNKTRCLSLFKGGGQVIKCSLAVDGHHIHKGYTSLGGMIISWTDKDSLESLRSVLEKKIGAFVGWRAWRLEKHDYLRSLTSRSVWEGPTMTTRLDESGKPKRVWTSPTTQFSRDMSKGDYGVYAYKTPSLMYEQLLFEYNNDMIYPIIGSLDLLGHVVEHELGYRAQKAIIRELWLIVSDETEGILSRTGVRDMEVRYQCPVHVLEAKKVKGWARWYTDTEGGEG